MKLEWSISRIALMAKMPGSLIAKRTVGYLSHSLRPNKTRHNWPDWRLLEGACALESCDRAQKERLNRANDSAQTTKEVNPL